MLDNLLTDVYKIGSSRNSVLLKFHENPLDGMSKKKRRLKENGNMKTTYTQKKTAEIPGT